MSNNNTNAHIVREDYDKSEYWDGSHPLKEVSQYAEDLIDKAGTNLKLIADIAEKVFYMNPKSVNAKESVRQFEAEARYLFRRGLNKALLKDGYSKAEVFELLKDMPTKPNFQIEARKLSQMKDRMLLSSSTYDFIHDLITNPFENRSLRIKQGFKTIYDFDFIYEVRDGRAWITFVDKLDDELLEKKEVPVNPSYKLVYQLFQDYFMRNYEENFDNLVTYG